MLSMHVRAVTTTAAWHEDGRFDIVFNKYRMLIYNQIVRVYRHHKGATIAASQLPSAPEFAPTQRAAVRLQQNNNNDNAHSRARASKKTIVLISTCFVRIQAYKALIIYLNKLRSEPSQLSLFSQALASSTQIDNNPVCRFTTPCLVHFILFLPFVGACFFFYRCHRRRPMTMRTQSI
jgi:hypothetical protein